MNLGQVVNVVRGYLEDIRAGKQFGRTLEGVSIGSGLTELKYLTPEFREMLDPIKDPLERIFLLRSSLDTRLGVQLSLMKSHAWINRMALSGHIVHRRASSQ